MATFLAFLMVLLGVVGVAGFLFCTAKLLFPDPDEFRRRP